MNPKRTLARLGQVLELSLDSGEVQPTEEYPIAGVYSFGRGLLKRSPVRGGETTFKKMTRLHRGDLIVSQLKAWEGALALVPDEYEGWFVSPNFPTFRPISEHIDMNYLGWYLRQETVWQALKSLARGMGRNV